MRFEAEALTFSYPKGSPVFRDISIKAEAGEILSVLGPNGAGKTTLLRCLLGFLKPEGGRVLIDGQDSGEIPAKEFWKRAAYVPQGRAQAFPYTVEETVLMGRSAYLGLFRQPGRSDREAAERAMEAAGVTALRNKSCAAISGGELQLTLIARALAAEPEMLVMDEPETGLDFRNQLVVMELIERLSRERGLTILFNTHYPEHAAAVSDRTLLMTGDGGGLFGTPQEVLTPAHMKRAFGVEIFMEDREIGGRRYTSIIPLHLADDEG